MNNQENSRKFKHKVKIQIRFSDIDAVNHVNNSIISQYYDVGRINYFQEILGEKFDWSDVLAVVVNTENNYYHSINQRDNIFVETKLEKFGLKSMTMFQQIVEENTNIIKSTCKTILAGYDKINHCSAEIPEDFKRKFLEFEK
ncbi:MAG: thioesterase family protein [Bacteroidales bacterium]|nr:thioesterase family protein [Bacteroidales bacterium]